MMTDFEDRLRSALDARAAEIQPYGAPPGLASRVKRRRAVRGVLAGAGAFVALVVAVSAVAWWPRIDDRLPLVGSAKSASWSGRAEAMPPGPLSARRDVSSVWTGSELIVWGGWTGNQAASEFFADGAAYNPATRSWRSLPAAPISARASQEAVWTGTEMIVWGGTGAKRGPFDLTDGAAYNPATGVWRRIASAPDSGRSAGRALYASGKMIVAGGDSSYDSSARTKVLVYDPAANRWSTVQAAMRVQDAALHDGSLVLAEVDDSQRLYLQDVDLGAPAAASPVAVPLSNGVERLSLAIGDDTVMVAVADPTGNHTEVLTGRLSGGGLPGSWSSEDTSSKVLPALQLLTGYRGLSVALSPDALLLAAVPEVSVVNPRTGHVHLNTTALAGKDAPCGISGALAWTGSALLSWGGQNCSATNTGNSAQGVVWTLKQ